MIKGHLFFTLVCVYVQKLTETMTVDGTSVNIVNTDNCELFAFLTWEVES